jgi:hypothetical protein
MGLYGVYVFCNWCGDVHPMGIGIELDLGPVDKKSIGDTYAGEPLPPQIANLMRNRTICPKTGKWFVQKDNNQVFLVLEKK